MKVIKKKIAIFSGAIPSTTFIEHLIEGISETQEVYLFGVIDAQYHYKSKNIKVFSTPKSHGFNFLITSYRVLRLFLKSPNSVFILVKEIRRFNKLYDKWIWFSKFLPIVLYRPDIFHMQWARDLEFYWFLKEKFNIKILVSLLGSHINYTPLVEPKIANIYRQTFPEIDAFHAVSKAISKEAQFYNANNSKITLIHSPIKLTTLQKFNSNKIKNNSTLNLISVGRHHWVKGYKYSLSAMKILKAKEGVAKKLSKAKW